MIRREDLYISVLTIAAIPLLAVAGLRLDPANWPVLLGLTALTVLFVMLRIEAPTGQSLTLNGAVNIISILWGGPTLGVWVVGLGQLTSGLMTGTDFRRTIFNTAQMIVTMYCTGLAYTLVGGQPHWNGDSLLPPLAAIGAYLLVNTFLVALLFCLLKRAPLMAVVIQMLKDGLEGYLIVQAMGLMAALMILKGGLAGGVVLGGLLLLLQRVLSRYYQALRRDAALRGRQAVQESLLRALVAAMDARDLYTSGHSDRVARYVDRIAEMMGLSQEMRDELKNASLLHDIGKIGIPDAILRKDGPLSPVERAIMMEHPTRGVQILSQVPNVPKSVLLAVEHHHEWINGGGYPAGLKGEEIPLFARIIGVADALDAMTSARPYRDGLPLSEALSRIRSGRGSQFDPEIADILLDVVANDPSLVPDSVAQVRPLHSDFDRLEEERAHLLPGDQAGQILPVHSRELRILYQMATEPRSVQDLTVTLHRALEILYDSVGRYFYSVLLFDPETNHLVVRAAAGAGQDLLGRAFPAPDQANLQSQSWHSGRAKPAGAGAPLMRIDPTAQSVLTVPLICEAQIVGVLQAESQVPGVFGQDDAYLLTAVARQLADVIEVARTHERMAYAATHDDLTGAVKRSEFYKRLANILDQAAQDQQPVAVSVLDLDNFKQINDTYGHLVGDEVLRQFGRYLRENLPEPVVIARSGGDEFALILPGMGSDEASQLIGRLAHSPEIPVKVQVQELASLQVSWGAAGFPNEGSTAEALVTLADQRMYQYKNERKTPPPPVAAWSRLACGGN